jgi:dTDP-4-dehydrorhamnose reductase
MSRILITGNTGQLGQELRSVLAPLGDIIGVGRDRLDLTQPETIRSVLDEVKPDLVVNAAAYTAVDKSESEEDIAYAANATAPGVLAEEVARLGAKLIHFSTDYVFDGTQSYPYREDDPTCPLGAYGRTKLAGEEAIRQSCDRHLILRTAWVYGVGGSGNFVKTMLRLGKERPELRVVCDQIGSPTWTGDIAETTRQIIAHSEDLTGTYHFTNSGVASWYDFSVAIFEEARKFNFPVKIQRVEPITTAEYPTPAKRPAYSVLAWQKLAKALGHYPPHWRESLRQMLSQLKLSD